jgi:glycosyltransferase involved in cell wall biosynthesis
VKLLFVAMAHTIHTARWIEQLQGQGHEIHVFPVGHGSPHPELRGVTLHPLLAERADGKEVAAGEPLIQRGLLWPFAKGRGTLTRRLEQRLPALAPAKRLARLIKRLAPDVVHVLHMQHAGYLMLSALEHLGDDVPMRLAYSSWGSDMYYYGKLSDHAPRIRGFLKRCDYYIADCQRDVRLAQEFGFRGETLGVFPVGGGYDLSRVPRTASLRPSQRRVIALKGYHQDNWAGRALVGLHAILLCATELKGYEIAIFSATPNTQHAGEFVRRVTGLDINVLPPLEHDGVLELMGRCRASIGLSITDGTPNAMLEAMIMGALPIQSDTVSTAEWITDGQNGLLTPAEDAHSVAAALRRALSDDALVDQAMTENELLCTKRLDRKPMREQVLAAYSRMLTRSTS